MLPGLEGLLWLWMRTDMFWELRWGRGASIWEKKKFPAPEEKYQVGLGGGGGG